MNAIAIVGMACVYPDARSPGELWENVLAQRRAFRRLPPERLRGEDYFSSDRDAPDRTYAVQAAVIEGYEFDRVAFRVAGGTFRSADLAHWLALDVASRALADAGFPDGNGLPRESTGVLLGNTLTGEFARANILRLRWPYARRVLDAALVKQGWSPERRQSFLVGLEADYKSPFPAVGEETLAGSLSNTIAGRICNQFDLKGGGYTLDGACASSLLAVANACSALATGDLDVVLAGGVDLSLDPFEIVGFAKTGALASDEMRVFDQRSTGFWPGEGCGFVTLMRHGDALAQGRRVYAVIRGWGISSDGSGGITRPETDGQIEALRRAYRRAGFSMDTVTYCEGHGTGTAVGDATELEVLTRVRREAKLASAPAALGSIKSNIGHTKAAAGIAGLIKATMAVHTQVLPPTTGCEQPHQLLGDPVPALRVLSEAGLWPKDRPLRASVSAMGFGGINAHVVLESVVAERRIAFSPYERSLARSHQDAELFLLCAESAHDLMQQADQLLPVAAGISRSELMDLAAQLQRSLEAKPVRAAIVASRPEELVERLQTLKTWLLLGVESRSHFSAGIFLGSGRTSPRIAFLFPGQGSPTHLDGGVWRRRFESVRELYARAALPVDGDPVSTRLMQPAVVTASLAGLKVMDEFGLTATAAIGHSLGEITSLHWAGAMDEETLLRIARARGEAMAELASPTGAMLAIAAPWQKVQALLNAEPLAVVGFNSPRQTVVAGEASAINRLTQWAEAAGFDTTLLPVSHAFHTPLVAAAVPVLAEQLARETFGQLKHHVISTITGAPLENDEDPRTLLCRQVTSPVRFDSALAALLGVDRAAGATDQPPARSISGVDLLIEVGPGLVLSNLVRDTTDVPVVSLDAGGPSLQGLQQTLGAAFALGAPVRHARLFEDRFTRPFALDRKPKFFVNPCELAPVTPQVAEEAKSGVPGRSTPSATRRADTSKPFLQVAATKTVTVVLQTPGGHEPGNTTQRAGSDTSVPIRPIDLIRQLVAERAELPLAAVQVDSRMLRDLHLNSITVGQLVSEAARRLGLPRMVGLTNFANASVAEMACALEELKQTGGTARSTDKKRQPPGVDVWIETFTMELVEAKRPVRATAIEAQVVPARSPHEFVNHCEDSKPTGANNGAATLDGSRSAIAGWQIFSPPGHPLAAPLREKLAQAGGGVLLCLPENPTEEVIGLMLNAARATAAVKEPARFVLVQHGWGGAGFARTLHLETPGLTTCVVNVPPAQPHAVEWIFCEAMSAAGYTEAHYDVEGHRREPRLKWRPQERIRDSECERNGGFPIGSGDVLLVTGGGKGIAAECALALGRETGARLALMGRSDPAADRQLAENLARITAAGVSCCYVRADVTDDGAVRRAVAEAEKKLGPVTALLHGAGTNTPQLIGALDEAAFRRTMSPKTQGARNVLAAIDADRLRLFITFGSIIARAGFRGEADYATANEWMTAFTEQFQAEHPQCRCLALEWSVWSGVGMGERLGRVESLMQQGIMPIPPDEGVRILLATLRRPPTSVALVVAGRFGESSSLKFTAPELPLRRFLERKRVYYPGVELIVDAELSVEADPYLNDHIMQKQRLFPAVLGLEAMAQVAMALAGSTVPPSFEQVQFTRPVAVSDKSPTTIQLAALRRGANLVEVCLRSEESDYHVDHFRALCRFGTAESGTSRLLLASSGSDHLALEPHKDLYGQILFHQGRFCRLRGYRLLKAKACVAEITPDDGAQWFGPYLPADFVLGNPGARDAALHAIQACIPHQRILPTGMDELIIRRSDSGARFVRARERERDGNNFIYDVEITDAHDAVIERWNGLRLRAVEIIATHEAWPDALLSPYLERRLEELVAHSAVSVALERDRKEARAANSDAAIQQALGKAERIWRRADGKPVTVEGEGVSASHAQGYTLAVAGSGGVACDLETVATRTDSAWRDLLGAERFTLAERIARDQSEGADFAATRLWAVVECMKKVGLTSQSPLVLESATADGWVLFRSGALLIATCITSVRGVTSPLAVAVGVRSVRATEKLPAFAEATA